MITANKRPLSKLCLFFVCWFLVCFAAGTVYYSYYVHCIGYTQSVITTSKRVRVVTIEVVFAIRIADLGSKNGFSSEVIYSLTTFSLRSMASDPPTYYMQLTTPP